MPNSASSEQHLDAFIFKSVPVTGELLAPALLTKFGDHRDRFPTPGDVQALAGTCPVTERSGKRKLVKFRHGCDKEFRGWFVVQCRQVIIWNDRSATSGLHPFKRSLDFLVRESGLGRAMIMSILDEPLCGWFVRRKSERAQFDPARGRPVQPINTYRVRMDDPLVPVDAERLVDALRNAPTSSRDPLERALQRVQWALDQPFDTLRAPDVRQPLRHPEWFKQGPLEALDLIQRVEPGLRNTACEDSRWTELAIACDALMDHVISPKDVVGDYYYFRKHWVGQVGRGQAWAIVLLRDRCYDPPAENGHRGRRDTWWLPCYDWLAQRVGVDTEAVADWLTSGMSGFVRVLEQQKGRDKSQPQLVSYHLWIALRDPLTPQDQVLYQEQLRERIERIPQAGESQFPLREVSGENGLTGNEEIGESELSPSGANVTRENELTGGGVIRESELSPRRTSGENALTGSGVVGEPELSLGGVSGESEHETGGSSGKPNCLKSLNKARIFGESPCDQQTAQPTRAGIPAIMAEAATHQDENDAGDDLALHLLKELVIRNPYRSRIVMAHVPVRTIWGWALYADHKGRGVKSFGGFMATVLLDEDRDMVPAPFDRLSRLHPTEWTAFALEARRQAEDIASPTTVRGDSRLELFHLWKETYGGLDFHQLPFGIGAEAARLWAAEHKESSNDAGQTSVGNGRRGTGRWQPDYG